MQVIEPRDFKRQKRSRSKSRLTLAVLLVLTVAGVTVYVFANIEDENVSKDGNVSIAQIDEPQKSGKLKTFSGKEFSDLYKSISYPNTQQIDEKSPITGGSDADEKIRDLALARGYRIQSAPVSNNLLQVEESHYLQNKAAVAWKELKSAAKKSGHDFALTAAYRSAQDQKQIFLQRLKMQNIPISGISSGRYDSQINQVLKSTAVPGYSRHHSGYTVDIECKSNLVEFKNSSCFKWLSKNNYENAKKYGWIPSYPDGAGLQGPDPEAWEYVWVGKEAVTE